MYRLVGLPCMILRKPEETRKRGEEMVEKLRLIEAQLTEWEDKQSVEFLELLPWWPERKMYRELKANGEVPDVRWWEALAFLENACPKDLGRTEYWGLRPPQKKKAPKGP